MYLPPYFFLPQHYFFQKILCCGKFVTTHYVLSHNTLFFKSYCVVRHVRNAIFFLFIEKRMCCGKFVTTHYFLSHNTLFFFKKYCVVRHVRNTTFFEKNNVLWQVCHNTSFFKKNIVLYAMSATQYFLKKIMCCDSKSNVL